VHVLQVPRLYAKSALAKGTVLRCSGGGVSTVWACLLCYGFLGSVFALWCARGCCGWGGVGVCVEFVGCGNGL